MTRNIIAQRIDEAPMHLAQYAVIATCFLLNLLDGYDIVAMSVAAPALSQDWNISPEEKGYILSSALAGMTLGAMLLAPLCDRYGRRSLMLAAAICTGIAMLVTALIPQSVALMLLIRFITGLGIGVIMASTTTIASEYSPERSRNFTVPLVVLGYPTGALAVGPISQMLMPSFGWESVFIVGGVATLATALVMFFLLPESLNFMANHRDNRQMWLEKINSTLKKMDRQPIEELPAIEHSLAPAKVHSILQPDLRSNTLKLWATCFCGLFTIYFLFGWIPSLFVDNGFSRAEGIFALTLFNLGGVIGIVSIGLITTRLTLIRPIVICFVISTALMLSFAFSAGASLWSLNLLIFLIGLFFQAAFTAIYTVLSRAYPDRIRATGVGWAIGLGRTGAIIAPIIAGFLVGMGWSMYPLFALFGLPVALMAILLATVRLPTTARPTATDPLAPQPAA